MFSELLKEEYADNNQSPITSYTYGSKKKVLWQCSICAYKWMSRIGHRVKGSGCPVCAKKKTQNTKMKNRPSITITNPSVAAEWNDDNEVELVSRGCNTKYKWKCQKCQNDYLSSPNHRCTQNNGCPYCSGRLATDKNRLSIVRPDLAKEFIGDASQVCGNSNKKYRWKCQGCSHEWTATANNRFQGRGCPQCATKNSKPQQTIESYLNSVNVEYMKEFKINDCRNIRPLPFDFAIMQKGHLLFLLEYQGEQHFFPIWGHEEFKKRQHNDNIKEQYCLDNNIQLFKINYWEQHEIIDKLAGKIQRFL